MPRKRSVLAAALLATSAAAMADPSPPSMKLTLGSYRAQGSAADTGTDLNLRWRRNDSDAWVGIYRDRSTGTQWRGGWDSRFELAGAAPLAVLPSVQLASGGFAGGSVALEAGDAWYGQIGLGRTNLRPYVNLNFDPNDAFFAAGGYRSDDGRQVSLSLIRDNRLDTGQQHLHLTLQWPTSGHDRLVLDLLHKHGRGDDGWVTANGATVTFDWSATFVRLAYDPHQNFGHASVWRFSGGYRF